MNDSPTWCGGCAADCESGSTHAPVRRQCGRCSSATAPGPSSCRTTTSCGSKAEDYYARIHLRDRTVLVRESLRSLVDELSGAGFVRVHRSAVARLSAIRAMEPLSSGDQRLTLTNGTRLRVSRTYRTALVKALSGGG